jgi:hypothetical protein
MWHIKEQKQNYYNNVIGNRWVKRKELRHVILEEKFVQHVLPKIEECCKLDIDCPYYMVYLKNVYIPTEKDISVWSLSKNQPKVVGVCHYPVLKDLDFARIIDPYTMYQELDRWFGVHANPDVTKVPVGSDEVLAEAKGFDRKFSFRKEPSNKKRRLK